MNTFQRLGSKYRTLSKVQINQVHEYTLRLMAQLGCRVECEEALDLLGEAGCDVRDPGRVKIPRRLVLEAIEAAPEKIDVFNRDGVLAMTFEEDACY
jgi:trimethylamine:corrinoid methyltransferase-like protein